jgi:hypothetical protein
MFRRYDIWRPEEILTLKRADRDHRRGGLGSCASPAQGNGRYSAIVVDIDPVKRDPRRARQKLSMVGSRASNKSSI